MAITRMLSCVGLRVRYSFAPILILANFLPQRADGNSKQIRRKSAVSPVAFQRLKNEFLLDASNFMPDQTMDTHSIKNGKLKQRRYLNGWTLCCFDGSEARHQHLQR